MTLRYALITFLSTILLLAGCQSRTEKRPGYLYLRLSSDITTLDPAFIVDVSGGSVAAKIFNGLVRFDEEARIVPDLAESYSISKDGKVYTFILRKGTRFHNGREVNSSDFKYSFERVLDPRTRSSRTWLFERISGAKEFTNDSSASVAGIETPAPHVLKISLERPFGPFLGLLAMPSAYVVPREDIEQTERDFSSHPVGTGPFMVEDWKRGRELVLSANDRYFSGKAKIGGMVYRIIPEELTSVAEFESGNLDVIGVPSTEYRRYSASPKWGQDITRNPGLNTYYLGFNCQAPPFNDRRVRQAMNYAVDRKRILNTLLEGRGEIAAGPVPPFFAGEGGVGYPYDPEKARRLLKEAGYDGNLSFRIYLSSDPETVDIIEVIQQYLKGIGVDTKIVLLEWSAFKEAINKGEADSFWLSWRADYPDPENFLFPVFHSSNWGSAGNRARFSDKAFDGMVEEAQMEPDDEKRNGLYRMAEQRIIDEAPWLFFWHKNDYTLTQSWVKGIKGYPIYNSDKGLDTFIVRTDELPYTNSPSK